MIRLTRRTAMVLAAFSLVATSLSATDGKADPADGKAEGTLTVNGKTTKVAHAYARSVLRTASLMGDARIYYRVLTVRAVIATDGTTRAVAPRPDGRPRPRFDPHHQ